MDAVVPRAFMEFTWELLMMIVIPMIIQNLSFGYILKELR
jgi:hypothetical protein